MALYSLEFSNVRPGFCAIVWRGGNGSDLGIQTWSLSIWSKELRFLAILLMGRVSGPNALGITVCNFCAPKQDWLRCGQASVETSFVSVWRRSGYEKPCLSGDTKISDLSNGELADSLAFYCLKINSTDVEIWWVLAFIAPLSEERRGGGLELIFANGLTPTEYSRRNYFSQKPL